MKKILMVLLVICVIIQGGFYPELYLLIGLMFSILLFFKKELFISFSNLFLFLIIFSSYFISALLHHFSLAEYSPVFQVLCYLVYFLLISGMKEEDRQFLYIGIIVSGIIVAYLGIFSYIDIFNLPGMVSKNRLQGVLQYANVAAVLLSMAVITGKQYAKKLQWAKPAMVIALQLTMSFGGILCFWIGILIYAMFQPKGKKLVAVTIEILEFTIYGVFTAAIYVSVNVLEINILSVFLSIIACGMGFLIVRFDFKIPFNKITGISAALAALAEIVGILMLRGGEALGTFQERITHSVDGLRAVFYNPLLGIGPGRWAIEKADWQSEHYRAVMIHNSYVQIAVDAGILALICLLFIIIFWIKKARKPAWSIAAVGCLLAHGLIDISFYFTGISLIGITLVSAGTIEAKEGKGLTLHKKSICLIALIAAGVYLYYNIAYRTM